MSMPLVSTHAHTALCGHGEGTVGGVAAAAEAAGLSLLALTEHFPLSPAYNPHRDEAMHAADVPGYLAAVERARAAHPGLTLLAGCELDWLGAREDRTPAELDTSAFELVLGSVHFVDGVGCDNPDRRERWEEPGGPDRVWSRYVDLWCEMATSSARIDVLAHPDLPKKLGYKPSFSLEPLYDRMVEAAVAGGRMIEVNTAGAYAPCREMYPAPGLLARFARAGVPCTVGTDAHRPAHVARGIKEAYRLMADAGYTELTVPLAHGERWRIPIV